jgi:hypothetical protein
MADNLAPKGRNVGYRSKPRAKSVEELAPFTQSAIKRMEVFSQMEDSTEQAIGKIESMREETLAKARAHESNKVRTP